MEIHPLRPIVTLEFRCRYTKDNLTLLWTDNRISLIRGVSRRLKVNQNLPCAFILLSPRQVEPVHLF